MQFKNPEILYALLLLIIPIIIHLFQLRRFKKVAFTNVQFLKRVTLKTRKSSQLKKWLTLLTRLLLFGCIILAFAQPYLSNTDSFSTENETVIYLDNSFSMQAKGENGNLLNRAVQDILEQLNMDEEISLFTNNSSFKNTTLKAISNDLIKMDYSPDQLSYEAAILKGKELFSDNENSIKNLILISDFQQKAEASIALKDSFTKLKLVKLIPSSITNIAIDSVYISKETAENLELSVKVNNSKDDTQSVAVSLFNDEKLIAKSAINLDSSEQTENQVVFTIPRDIKFDGRLSIEDASLQYDNTLYFNLGNAEKIKVLSINQADDGFLRKLYSEDEFEYTSINFDQLDYNRLLNQNLVVLNELENIPNSLVNALDKFTQEGGTVLIIPSENANVVSYNQMFGTYSLSPFGTLISSEKKVTNINFSHPLFNNVFDKRINNFQYPKVNSFYPTTESSTKTVLSFENGQAYLSENNEVFRFSAALNDDNSNFKNSPLIVPALYNIGKQSLKMGNLYYTIATKNVIDVPVSISQDDILSLQNENGSVIPLQRTYANKVEIITNEYPQKAGIITIKNKDQSVKNISFNYDRTESQLKYLNLENLNNRDNIAVSDSVVSVINEIKSESKVNELWKWFVIFALAFLLIELLILKFLK